jgi:hypothetical protein
MGEIIRPPEKLRPVVSPKPEIWELCKSLAEKHDLTPFEVLDRFVKVGSNVARIQDLGGTVMASVGNQSAEVKVFCEGQSKTSLLEKQG